MAEGDEVAATAEGEPQNAENSGYVKEEGEIAEQDGEGEIEGEAAQEFIPPTPSPILPTTIDALFELHPKKLDAYEYHAAFAKARHRASNALRGVKAVRKSNLRDAEAVRELLTTAKEFQHPNVIRVVDVLEDHFYIYIVMPYCSGGNLVDRYLNTRVCGEAGCAVYMQQIFSALNYLHTVHQICHRDVRPDNILFLNSTPTSPLQLAQLSLATKCQIGRKSMKTRVGTPFYVAPEVLLGHYNEKCDLWFDKISDFIDRILTTFE